MHRHKTPIESSERKPIRVWILCTMLGLCWLPERSHAEIPGYGQPILNHPAEYHEEMGSLQLAAELRKLLRRVSFNIVAFEKGFSMTLEGEKIKFTSIAPHGGVTRKFRISGPRVNGLVELSIGDGHFEDIVFWQDAQGSLLAGMAIPLEKIPFR